MKKRKAHRFKPLALTLALCAAIGLSQLACAQSADWVQINAAGQALFANSDLTGAEQKWLEALRLARAIAQHDPRVAETMAELGRLYAKRQSYEQSAAMLKAALRIKQLTYGAYSPELLDDLKLYGQISRQLGLEDAALEAERSSEKIRLLNHSELSSQTGTTFRAKGSTVISGAVRDALAAQQLEKAKTLVLAALKSGASLDQSDCAGLTLAVLVLRAQLQSTSAAGARDFANDVLCLVQQLRGYQHSEVAYALKLRAATLRTLGDRAAAEDDEQRAAKIYQDLQARCQCRLTQLDHWHQSEHFDLQWHLPPVRTAVQPLHAADWQGSIGELLAAERETLDWRNRIISQTLVESAAIRAADTGEMQALLARQRQAEALSRSRHRYF
jgi:tetratricopeptide (TPR) repeat protein